MSNLVLCCYLSFQGALERTLGAKDKDYEELMLLSGDANHAREVSTSHALTPISCDCRCTLVR
jgi:hypothetical protein